MGKIKVCHLTSAHDKEDDRIFLKECVSLADNGYEVYLVECGDSYVKNGVNIVGAGQAPSGRLKRMTGFSKTVFKKALELDCDIYHFHDPELLQYGLKLKKAGKRVIFDSHEDVPAQIMDKDWIPSFMRKMVSGMYRNYETKVAGKIDCVITATSHIEEQFKGRAARTLVVNNYPKLDDITFHEGSFADRDAIVCYAGGISELRGEKTMIKAMEKVNGKLIMAGDHERCDVGDKVHYTGKLDRAGVNGLYGSAVAGLCILKPIENYFYSQPIKMYEYMAAGIPFVCSDFPGWKVVAEESGAGICVESENCDMIAEAINELLSDREKAQRMGRSGHEYVITKCTWKNEEKNLLELYSSLAG